MARKNTGNPLPIPEPSLFLSIRDHWYRVEPIALDDPQGDRAYRLRKDDGQRYDVTDSRFGPACDCPDFIFRRDGIDPAGCKHVQALRRYGLVSTPTLPRTASFI